MREIQAELALARYRDVIDIIPLFAARPIDLQRALDEHQPQIIHFSGHGTADGEIMLLNDEGNAVPVTAATLVALFAPLADQLRLVILNSCYATLPSTAITSVVACVIGMTNAISDVGATKFVAAVLPGVGLRSLSRSGF